MLLIQTTVSQCPADTAIPEQNPESGCGSERFLHDPTLAHGLGSSNQRFCAPTSATTP